jgi:hypothetical protein
MLIARYTATGAVLPFAITVFFNVCSMILEYFIIFRLETKQDHQKYGEIISDFSYFKMSDEFDHKIDNNPVSTGFFEIQMFKWSGKFNRLACKFWYTHHTV